jgi:hypothetical protein
MGWASRFRSHTRWYPPVDSPPRSASPRQVERHRLHNDSRFGHVCQRRRQHRGLHAAVCEQRRLTSDCDAAYLLCASGCLVPRWLCITHHPAVARVLGRYGHIVVPFVLVGLGVYIIAESGTLKLLRF